MAGVGSLYKIATLYREWLLYGELLSLHGGGLFYYIHVIRATVWSGYSVRSIVHWPS